MIDSQKPMVQINIKIENINIGNITVKGEENALPKENESSQIKSNSIKAVLLIIISFCGSQIAKLWQYFLG